jgi:hypothetical protein
MSQYPAARHIPACHTGSATPRRRRMRPPAPATEAASITLRWTDTDNKGHYKVTAGCGDIRISDIYPYAPKDQTTWEHRSYLHGGVDSVCSGVGDIVYEVQACNSAGCSTPATLTRPVLR